MTVTNKLRLLHPLRASPSTSAIVQQTMDFRLRPTNAIRHRHRLTTLFVQNEAWLRRKGNRRQRILLLSSGLAESRQDGGNRSPGVVVVCRKGCWGALRVKAMPPVSKIALPYEPSSTANRDAARRREETRAWLARRQRELAAVPSPPIAHDTVPQKLEDPPA